MEYVTAVSEDGIVLGGLRWLTQERPGVAVAHIHGAYASAFEDRFFWTIAETLGRRGVESVSGNTRGRDYVVDAELARGGWLTAGGCLERLSDSGLDIDAWLSKFPGSDRLVLSGHSLGALKAIRWATSGNSRFLERLAGLVLLAPADMWGIMRRQHGIAGWESLLTAARKGDGVETPFGIFMARDSYLGPVSVATFCEIYGDSRIAGQLDIGDVGHVEATDWAKIQVPVFVAYGNADERICDKPSAYIDLLKAHIPSPVSASILDGGDHNFSGLDGVLAAAVDAWVAGLG